MKIEISIGDKVCYNTTYGDTSQGIVKKINKKTIKVDDIKQYCCEVIVDKELIYSSVKGI